MSLVTIQGNASGTGTLTIAAPDTNSNYTLTLPTATTTLAGTDATQTLTNKTLTSPTITGAVVSSMASSVITSRTAVSNPTSPASASIDFISIPSWVKRITVMFNGISTSATADVIVQLGTGATPTYTTSGYLGSCSVQSGTVENFTTGYKVVISNAAASVWHGNIVIDNVTGNTWAQSAVLGNSNAAGVRTSGGSIPLGAALTAVRITTNSTDTFDLGSINILYE